MAIHNKRLIIAGVFSYSLNGTTITNSGGSATTAEDVKPDGTTVGDWVEFGKQAMAEFSVDDKREDVIAGVAAGGYRRVDVLRAQLVHDAKITLHDVNEHVLRMFFRCAAITDGTALQIGTTTAGLRGWWQMVGVAQNGGTVMTFQFYGEATVKVLKADPSHYKPEITIEIFHNTLDTLKSQLTNAA